jgi:hypothetical protein
MAWTQADLDKLDAAIARGIRSVSYADQTTVYATFDEMRAARGMIAEALSSVSATPRPRAFTIVPSSGL